MADYDAYEYGLKGYGGERMEPAFHIIRAIAKFLGSPVMLGFTFYALLSVTNRYVHIKKETPNLMASMLVYMSYIFVVQDMIAIRAAVASSILLIAVNYRFNKDWLKLFITIAIACMFHYTAAIFLVLLVTSENKPRKIFYLAILLGSYVLNLVGITLTKYIGLIGIAAITNLLSMYDYVAEANIFNLVQIGHILICIVFWIFSDRLVSLNPKSLIYLKLYTIALCFVPLLSDMLVIAYRLSEMLLSVEVILLPIGFYAIFKKTILKKGVILAYSLIIFYFTMTNLQYWNPSVL